MLCFVNYIGECKLLAGPLQFLIEHWDNPRKQSELFVGFIKDQIAVLILSEKFQTDLNEVLNYVDWINVQK